MVRFEIPYATNHQILMRVAGGGERCWTVQAALQQKIEEKGYKIKGMDIKVTVEPTAERKAWYRTYFANLRAAESLVSTDKFDPDAKGLAIYSKPSYEVLGKVNRTTCKFEWDRSNVEAIGMTVTALESAAF